jgi:LysM repeat protein/4-amino-4-deoxy-L-arabinose transferase-like glycosyltransferase
LREDSPRGRAPAGTSGAVTGIPAIVVLLVTGLILRFIIAQLLLPGSGFPNDLDAFRYWGNDIAQNGPIGFYARTGFVDYPPVYLLMLGVVGAMTGGNMGAWVKLLPILADAGLAGVVWLMAREMGVTNRRALIAAAIVVFNPVTWFNSAIWGQADAVGTIFLLLGLRELQKDHREAASALAVLAVLTKLQLGILGFVVGFVVLRRSLVPKTGEPEPEPERVLSSIGAGLLTAGLICLPFTGLDVPGAAHRLASVPGLLTVAMGLVAGIGIFYLSRRYLPIADAARRTGASALLGLGAVVASASMVFDAIANHVGGSFVEYPYLTLNAYNPWALITDGGNALDRTLQWWLLHDAPWTDASNGTSGTGLIIGPLPSTVVLAALAAVVVMVGAAYAGWRLSHGSSASSSEPAVEPDAPATPAAESAAGDSANAGRHQSFAGTLRAEFEGLSGAFLVAAATIAAVVVVAMTGRLYAVALGDGLLVAVLLGVSAWAAWRDDRLSLLVALTVLAIAFFVVPTRAHERYLFPFFGLGAVLLAVSWRWSVAYVILAIVNAANLLAVLVEYSGIPSGDGTLAGTLNDWGHGLLSATWFGGIIWPVALCSVAVGLGMIWALLQLRPRAVAALDREMAGALREAETPGWWSRLGSAMAGGETRSAPLSLGLPASTTASAVAASATAPADQDPRFAPGSYYDFDAAGEGEEWADGDDDRAYLTGPDRPVYVPGMVMRLWYRVARPSSHPDRSAALDSEPRGRLDKLDVWVVVALVVAILSMRVYRLDEPLQMHFDEVYHARTATEFLQDWNYQLPHNIYEWTHPDLAKYAIAGGITLFSDDKVTATGDLGVTIKDALVQPRTPASPLADPNNTSAQDGGRYGDRAFVATGSKVLVYDLETRELVQTYAIPGASAFSAIGASGLLYVGTSSGHVYTIDTNSLDDVQNGLAAKPAPALELSVGTGLAIAHLYAGASPYLLAADASGAMVSVDLSQKGGAIVARGTIPGAADFASLGTGPAVLTYTPSATSTPTATPTPTPTTTPTPSATSPPTSTPTPAQVTYTVQDGDTLGSIANHFGIEWQALYAANRGVIGDDPYLIQVGTVLVIPRPAAAAGPTTTATPTPTPTPSSTPTPTPAPTSTPTTAASEAEALASALGLSQASVETALSATSLPGLPVSLKLGTLSTGQIAAVRTLIDQGKLPGIAVEAATSEVMVAYQSGIGILDARSLTISSTIATAAPATSIAINYSDLAGTSPRSDQDTYVAAGNSILLVKIASDSTPWTVTKESSQPLQKMPGEITKVVFDRATRVAQALGRTPDGTGWTVYAIESNGNTVFSDAKLPFEPVAFGLDSSPLQPDLDREQVLAFAPDGSLATVDVGQFAFSWRIIGVLFGALMAVCLYLLVRLLFRRRSIGLLVALFSLTDGMLFVQSRIAMNDTYVGGFLLLAYLLFALLWLNVWKRRAAFWVVMPILGVILGLGLASKWVGLYAMASIGILILIRSALGRLITILGLAFGTGALGWMAIAEMSTQPGTGNPTTVLVLLGLAVAVVVGGFVWAQSTRTTPDKVFVGIVTAVIAGGLLAASLVMSPSPALDSSGASTNGSPNYTYFLIMLAITAIAAAANAYHPIAWAREELNFAVGAPIVVGALALVGGVFRHNGLLLEVGVAGLVLGAAAAAGFWFAGTLGLGPLALPPTPDDPLFYADQPAPAPEGWLRLGTGFGLPALWMAVCVMVLPIVVYVGLYVPWAMPWQPETAAATASYGGSLPVLFCSSPQPDPYNVEICPEGDGWPSGHTGQTLWGLTQEMYNYHNDLRASHPASSPWWAWPMDLKPVWFENATYAGDQGTMIYDGGNPAIWWLAIFAMGFICWQAFKRRSLGLSLLAIAFFWQWLSWARIDRAAFQYHFYTALPFFLAALAYFLAELWHGPSRRTWLLARFAAAVALIFPALAWLLKYPLCGLARVSTTDYWGNTICGSGTGDVRIETRMLLIAIVLLIALAALPLILWRIERRQDAGEQSRSWIVQLLVPVGFAGLVIWWLGQNGSRDIVFDAALPTDGIVILLLPILALLAFFVLTARNPRRFVLGACAFVVVAFLALYPNLSALPMPNAIINVYNGLLPTWFYGFEFSVNLQQSNAVGLTSTMGLTLAMGAVLVAGVAAWVAWERRVVVGFRRHSLLTEGQQLPVTPDAGPAPAEAESAPEASSTAADAAPAPSAPPEPPVSPAPRAPRKSRKDKPEN